MGHLNAAAHVQTSWRLLRCHVLLGCHPDRPPRRGGEAHARCARIEIATNMHSGLARAPEILVTDTFLQRPRRRAAALEFRLGFSDGAMSSLPG